MEADNCIECFKSTAMGTDRFVNRVPAGNDDEEGFMCAECVSKHINDLLIDFKTVTISGNTIN